MGCIPTEAPNICQPYFNNITKHFHLQQPNQLVWILALAKATETKHVMLEENVGLASRLHVSLDKTGNKEVKLLFGCSVLCQYRPVVTQWSATFNTIQQNK